MTIGENYHGQTKKFNLKGYEEKPIGRLAGPYIALCKITYIMYFSPRKVPSGNMKFWFVEALELSKRKAFFFLLLGLVSMWFGALDESGIILVCVFPLILSLGCVVAKSADFSESSLKKIVEVAPQAWMRVFFIGLMPLFVLFAITLLIETISPGNPGAFFEHLEKSQDVSETRNLIGFSIVIAIGASLIGLALWITSYLWFLWPLIVIGELPAVEAFNQSFDGFYINKFIVWPYAVSVLSLLLVHILPMLFIPWLAISTSMMYVSYRDVWLGRKENHPALVKTAEPVLSNAT